MPIEAFEWVIGRILETGFATQSAFRESEVRGRYGGFLFDLIAGLEGFEEDPTVQSRSLRRSKRTTAGEAVMARLPGMPA